MNQKDKGKAPGQGHGKYDKKTSGSIANDTDMVGNSIEYSTNDIFMNALDNMHIISGCNGAGKVRMMNMYIC